MYEIIATKDFVDLIRELPIENTHILTRSFISIKKIPDVEKNNTFLDDLMEQIRNQEVE